MHESPSVHIIGSGFAGLSAACFMAKAGYEVTVLEKLDSPGGRARKMYAKGFTFDMGPSWYWMPDVFERFFDAFGKTTHDFYSLVRLDPSYRIFWEGGVTDIPAGSVAMADLFESIEAGSGRRLLKFLKEGGTKYREGMKMAYQPSLSISEFLSLSMLRSGLTLDLFSSIEEHVNRSFSNPKLRKILEFPSLFLGARPSETPAMYTMMNYADIVLGTWYPKGGISGVAESIYKLAVSLGVQFHFDEPVTSIQVENNSIKALVTPRNKYLTQKVISAADYRFTESLLSPEHQTYSESYWNSRKMAPSCILFYLGINKKIPGLLHHSLFFDVPFDIHADEIYKSPQWPSQPLFYMSAPSVTDPTVCPPGCENIFLLVPVAAGLNNDHDQLRERYFNLLVDRIEKRMKVNIRDSIVVLKSFSVSDFTNEYNSFKGNAYGMANTIRQTAIFKPACRSKKVDNLFYCGQLTVPGPGVPPALISGEIAAGELLKQTKSYRFKHSL